MAVIPYPPPNSIRSITRTNIQLEGGDSGAWVLDNATGHVCGHVLAYSSASSVAYIAPMEVLLEDMAATLGATITLPDSAVLAEDQAILQPPTVTSSLGPPVLLKSAPDGHDSNVLANPLGACDAPCASSLPLQASPPALVHELSNLKSAEVDTNAAQTGGSWDKASGGILSFDGERCRMGERTGNEALTRVKARG